MWSDAMEEEFRNTYDKNAYDHEVLAEFGVEEAGVFDKDKVEEATQIDNYAYFDQDKYTYAEAKYTIKGVSSKEKDNKYNDK